MSCYKQVTHNNGIGGTYVSTMTDHTDEIAALRADSMALVRTVDPEQATDDQALRCAAMMTASDLLEAHDATGISLDTWAGPRALVELCLRLLGYPDDTFLTNGA